MNAAKRRVFLSKETSRTRSSASCAAAATMSKSAASSAKSFSPSLIAWPLILPLARNLRAAGGELCFKFLETAIQMVNAIDDRLALRGKAGDHQAYRRAQICRHHRRADQLRNARHHSFVSVYSDLCAQTRQFGRVHEAVFED